MEKRTVASEVNLEGCLGLNLGVGCRNQQFASITEAGQLNIPVNFRKKMGIQGKTKALIFIKGDTLVVKPKLSFNQLAGSIKTNVKLSDEELKKARKAFQEKWFNEKK